MGGAYGMPRLIGLLDGGRGGGFTMGDVLATVCGGMFSVYSGSRCGSGPEVGNPKYRLKQKKHTHTHTHYKITVRRLAFLMFDPWATELSYF